MIKFLLKRPIAVLMATLSVVLLGINSSYKIPTSLLPEIPIPKISVLVDHPNITARELEDNIIKPLRNQLQQINRLENIVSNTQDGLSVLQLEFEFGTDTHFAFIETNEKIDGALNFLPRNLERPKVVKASVSDIPILNLSINLKKEYSNTKFLELSEFTQSVLKKRIEQLENVAIADINGIAKSEIRIIPKKERIERLGVSNNTIIQEIRNNNFELGNLIVQDGLYQYNFKFGNPLYNKEDIEKIYLNLNGKIIQLKEIADVNLVLERDEGIVFKNSKRAIILSIIKQSGSQINELKKSIEFLISSLEKEYPEIEFTINQDQSKLLKLSINNLKSSLIIGSLLAVLVMFFFLKDFRSPIIIAISIPISLILSLLILHLLGITINIVSLSGLILGVGMMIDNSIIVIDNIAQKLQQKKSLLIACTEGTNEIISPLISSVLTTCSVFLPLLLLSGITGALFFDQAIAVATGLFCSLLVSILLIPVIYYWINQKKNIEFKKNNRGINIEAWYEIGYFYLFKKKWIVYGISVLGILSALAFILILDYSELPTMRESETILKLDWNEDISPIESQKRIDQILYDIDNIDLRISEIGKKQYLFEQGQLNDVSESSIYIQTNNASKLRVLKKQIAEKLKSNYSLVDFSFNPPKNLFQYIFGNNQNKYTAEVYNGKTFQVPDEANLKIITPLFLGKNQNNISIKNVVKISVLHENLALYKVEYSVLISQMKTIFNENLIDNIKSRDRYIPIKLGYTYNDINEVINTLFVKNFDGEDIPLKKLIRIEIVNKYKTIKASKEGEFLEYSLDIPNFSSLEPIMESFESHQDFGIRINGEWKQLDKMGKEFLFVSLIAILLLYFIMASQFESFWQPLIILLEIPIDIGGALFFLWLFGGTINVMSIIGIIVMSGIIINDSILKLHTINLLRKKGLSVLEAIKEGGKLRLKPILMTSLTTILALIPFLFIDGLGADLQKPLALTVIGGMLIGTFISIYFIPLMYYVFSKNKIK